jgi:hypothetical protein
VLSSGLSAPVDLAFWTSGLSRISCDGSFFLGWVDAWDGGRRGIRSCSLRLLFLSAESLLETPAALRPLYPLANDRLLFMLGVGNGLFPGGRCARGTLMLVLWMMTVSGLAAWTKRLVSNVIPGVSVVFVVVTCAA